MPVTRPAFARAVDTRLTQLLHLAWARLSLDPATIPAIDVDMRGHADKDVELRRGSTYNPDGAAVLLDATFHSASLVVRRHRWTITCGHTDAPIDIERTGGWVARAEHHRHPIGLLPAPDDTSPLYRRTAVDSRLADTAWALAKRAAAAGLGSHDGQQSNPTPAQPISFLDMFVDQVVADIKGADQILLDLARLRSSEAGGDPLHDGHSVIEGPGLDFPDRILVSYEYGDKCGNEDTTDANGLPSFALVYDPGTLRPDQAPEPEALEADDASVVTITLKNRTILFTITNSSLPETLLAAAVGRPLGSVVDLGVDDDNDAAANAAATNIANDVLASLRPRPIIDIANGYDHGSGFKPNDKPLLIPAIVITVAEQLVRLGDLVPDAKTASGIDPRPRPRTDPGNQSMTRDAP